MHSVRKAMVPLCGRPFLTIESVAGLSEFKTILRLRWIAFPGAAGEYS